MPHLFPALERTLRETEFGPSQDEHGPSGLPQRPADPARRARILRRRRRPARRHHEGVSRVAHQRRHRLAAGALADACSTEPGLLHRDLGSRPQAAWSRSRITTPTTSSSGARTACAPASTWARCRPRSDGPGPGRRRSPLRRAARQGQDAGSNASSSMANISIQQRRVEGTSRRRSAEDRTFFGELFARGRRRCSRRKGRSTSMATGCLSDGVLGPGWRWSAAWARSSTPPRSAATCRAVHRHNSQAEPGRARQPPAPDLREWATRAACCSAPGPRAGRCHCPSSIPTKSGPGSSISAPRT